MIEPTIMSPSALVAPPVVAAASQMRPRTRALAPIAGVEERRNRRVSECLTAKAMQGMLERSARFLTHLVK